MEQLLDALHIAIGALFFVIAGVFLIKSVEYYQNTVDMVEYRIESVYYGEKPDYNQRREMEGYELILLKSQIPDSGPIFGGYPIARNRTYEVEFRFDSSGKLKKANYHQK